MKAIIRIAALSALLFGTPSLMGVGFENSPSATNGNHPVMQASSSPAAMPQDAGVGDRSVPAKEPEDEEAAFKYSTAVKGIGKITGLSPVNAYWLCVVINFAMVAGLIFVAMKSNVPAMLRGRTQEIKKGIEEAKRASEEAGRRLHDIEERLSRMNVEIGEFQKRAEDEAYAEEERIKASIEEEKHKIIEAAEQEVVQVTNAARRELQKYAVKLAVEMAEKGIHVDMPEDKVLIQDFAEQLGSDSRRNGNT
jgi:F-type H+-transporting ATPase subunit b